MSGKKLEITLAKAKKHENKFKNIIFDTEKLRSFNNSIEKLKKDYLENPKPLATRKSSEMFLDIVSKLLISLEAQLI